MQYALLIYEAPGAYDDLGGEERKALTGEYMAVREDERFVDGGRLKGVETATTVRVQDGQTLVADGPFADRRRSSAGTTCSRPKTSMPRSRWLRGSRQLG